MKQRHVWLPLTVAACLAAVQPAAQKPASKKQTEPHAPFPKLPPKDDLEVK